MRGANDEDVAAARHAVLCIAGDALLLAGGFVTRAGPAVWEVGVDFSSGTSMRPPRGTGELIPGCGEETTGSAASIDRSSARLYSPVQFFFFLTGCRDPGGTANGVPKTGWAKGLFLTGHGDICTSPLASYAVEHFQHMLKSDNI